MACSMKTPPQLPGPSHWSRPILRTPHKGEGLRCRTLITMIWEGETASLLPLVGEMAGRPEGVFLSGGPKDLDAVGGGEAHDAADGFRCRRALRSLRGSGGV